MGTSNSTKPRDTAKTSPHDDNTPFRADSQDDSATTRLLGRDKSSLTWHMYDSRCEGGLGVMRSLNIATDAHHQIMFCANSSRAELWAGLCQTDWFNEIYFGGPSRFFYLPPAVNSLDIPIRLKRLSLPSGILFEDVSSLWLFFKNKHDQNYKVNSYINKKLWIQKNIKYKYLFQLSLSKGWYLLLLTCVGISPQLNTTKKFFYIYDLHILCILFYIENNFTIKLFF